jgi:hypothetical protein
MADAEEPTIELNVSPEKVCYIIAKAREFDARDEPVEPDPGSNPVDTGEREVLGSKLNQAIEFIVGA